MNVLRQISTACVVLIFSMGCAGTKPSFQGDAWCAETQVLSPMRSVSTINAVGAYKAGGLDAAISAVERKYGPVAVASGDFSQAVRSSTVKREAAKRGCDLVVLTAVAAMPRIEGADGPRTSGTPSYNVLFARRLAN